MAKAISKSKDPLPATDALWKDVETLEDVDALEKEHYPKGIKTARKEDFFQGGAYIGFNLCRYGYEERLAAQIHVARDLMNGCGGASYGMPFKPYYQTHTDEDGTWFEVYTG